MLYMQADEHKELCKMYKILKDIPYDKKVSVGDVVVSCLQEEDRAYPSEDEYREWLFSFTRSYLGDMFDEWFEEIDEAYYYNSKTKQVEAIDIEEAYRMDRGEHKYCFSDIDKALELLEEEQNKNLPKNLDFKTFVTSYISDLHDNSIQGYTPEPLEIVFGETEFLLAIDWYRNNYKDLEKFLSKEVFNSYIDKIILNQEHGRIKVVLTSSKYRD